MHPWDRQETDSEEAWALFLAYRDQRPPRRLYETCAKGKTRKSPKDLLDLFVSGRWGDRVLAWDRHLDGVVQAEARAVVSRTAQERLAEQEWVLRDLTAVAADQAKKLLEDVKANDACVLKAREVVAVVEAAVKLSRLVRGESTETIAVGPDPAKLLSPEELDQLARLQEKARGGEKH